MCREKFLENVGREGYVCTVTYMKDGSNRNRFECVTENDTEHFRDLSEEEQRIALRWLRYNIFPSPTDTPFEDWSSYGMKHVLEGRTNIYMTNNQFKEAMLLCGFFPADTDELNWHFCIKERSPIFVVQADKMPGLPMLGDPMNYSEEVVDHVGNWVYEHGSWVCDQCGKAPNRENHWDAEDEEPPFAYCPHCGALCRPDDV